jgi:hypothetical protein
LAIMDLQGRIVERFLAAKASSSSEPERRQEPLEDESLHGEAEPAQLLGIGGIDGKWGRRLFLTVRVNGRNLRLYGTRKQLATHITAAGKRVAEEMVFEGAPLNLTCRVVTEPSEDGRFVNVVAVLPSARSGRASIDD